MSNSIFREIEYSDAIDFINKMFLILNEYEGKHFIFRGQNGKDELGPSISRGEIVNKIGIFLPEIESVIIELLQREFVAYVNPLPSNILEYLAIAQHHGLPTRLLDWTLLPVYALWFALPSARYRTFQRSFVNNSKCYPTVIALEIKNTDFYDQANLPLKSAEIDKSDKIKFYNPKPFSKRILTQQGLFSVHRFDSNKNNFISLENEKDFLMNRICVKFIPNKVDGFDGATDLFTILQQLSHLGANYRTIYPDLDGFCKNIGLEMIQLMFEKYLQEIKIAHPCA